VYIAHSKNYLSKGTASYLARGFDDGNQKTSGTITTGGSLILVVEIRFPPFMVNVVHGTQDKGSRRRSDNKFIIQRPTAAAGRFGGRLLFGGRHV
tara:strand:+ start:419 stop:703 length:285 start_codon:yes stop_codon:yes gene_type:complete